MYKTRTDLVDSIASYLSSLRERPKIDEEAVNPALSMATLLDCPGGVYGILVARDILEQFGCKNSQRDVIKRVYNDTLDGAALKFLDFYKYPNVFPNKELKKFLDTSLVKENEQMCSHLISGLFVTLGVYSEAFILQMEPEEEKEEIAAEPFIPGRAKHKRKGF